MRPLFESWKILDGGRLKLFGRAYDSALRPDNWRGWTIHAYTVGGTLSGGIRLARDGVIK